MQIFVKSNTGVIHKGIANSQNIYCNYSGQRRTPYVYKVSEKEALNPEAKHCKKCFA